MVFSLFEYLDQVKLQSQIVCSTFGKFFTKNSITFDLTKIERKKIYFICMTFCCASNGAIKNFEIARKKINFFTIYFSIKS